MQHTHNAAVHSPRRGWSDNGTHGGVASVEAALVGHGGGVVTLLVVGEAVEARVALLVGVAVVLRRHMTGSAAIMNERGPLMVPCDALQRGPNQQQQRTARPYIVPASAL